jgi:hypothetical protein
MKTQCIKSRRNGTKKAVRRIVKQAVAETLASVPPESFKGWHELWREATEAHRRKP